MKNAGWIFLFFIVLLADMIAIVFHNELLQFVFKPLIIPFLIGYFNSVAGKSLVDKTVYIVFALFFSWIGDVLLLFQAQSEWFFLAGLISFLLAHLFYIYFFYALILTNKISKNFWTVLPVLIMYAIFMSLLTQNMTTMKWPVRVYGAIISIMLMLALHLPRLPNKRAGFRILTGAILFYISDLVLAVNKFYISFEKAGLIVMLTYGLAQLFIVGGVLENRKTSGKEYKMQ